MLVRNNAKLIVIHTHDGNLQHIHARGTRQQLVRLRRHQQRAVEMAKRSNEAFQTRGTTPTQNALRNHVVHHDDGLNERFALRTTLHLIRFQPLKVIQKFLLVPFIQHQDFLLIGFVPCVIGIENA